MSAHLCGRRRRTLLAVVAVVALFWAIASWRRSSGAAPRPRWLRDGGEGAAWTGAGGGDGAGGRSKVDVLDALARASPWTDVDEDTAATAAAAPAGRALTPDELTAALELMDERLRIYKVSLPKRMKLFTKQCGVNFGHIRGYGVEKYFVEQLHAGSRWRTDEVAEASLFFLPVTPCAARWEHKVPGMSKDENYEVAKRFTKEYVAKAVQVVRDAVPAHVVERLAWRNFFWISSQDRGVEFAEKADATFALNAVALVNTADEAMGFRACRDVATVCNVNFDLPPIADGLIEAADPWLARRRLSVRGGQAWNAAPGAAERLAGEPDAAERSVRSSNYGFEASDPMLSPRKRLAFFAGNLESNIIRKNLHARFGVNGADGSGDGGILMVEGRMDDDAYRQALASSTFCLHIAGHQVWSPRLIEYLWFGCVPVIIADGYFLPLAGLLDWSEFSVKVCMRDAHRVDQILAGLSASRVDELRKGVLSVRHHFTYYAEPRFGDAFHMTLLQLFMRSLRLTTRREDDLGGCPAVADSCLTV